MFIAMMDVAFLVRHSLYIFVTLTGINYLVSVVEALTQWKSEMLQSKAVAKW
jgi:hypothetical protein